VGDLEEVVEGTGLVGFADGELATLAPRVGGTVTEVHLEEGDVVEPMAPVVELDGSTIWAVTGDAPIYRDLAVGAEGADVETLEASLAAAAHDPGEVDEVFDADTQAALEEWQESNDLDVTGSFQAARFVWAPVDATMLELDATRGALVQAGQPLATAGPSEASAVRVAVDQADVTTVAIGDEASITVDGVDGALSGSVTAISSLPVDGTDYEVLVSLDSGDQLLAGMEATVSIVTDTITDVVLVPTGALGGTASAPTIDVLVDGVAETRPVTTGLTTPTQVEITSGVTAGDEIVIGEVAE
jgi:multidrug efflux pump subunit AcrA (membrane-fusion protein)